MGTSITATRIRLLRSMHKLTQEALAEKIGANRVTISHYESGAYNPSHDAILKMAKCLTFLRIIFLEESITQSVLPILLRRKRNKPPAMMTSGTYVNLSAAIHNGVCSLTQHAMCGGKI